MVLKVNGAIKIQYKAIELGSDHKTSGGGGGAGVFRLATTCFCRTFRARIFFSKLL